MAEIAIIVYIKNLFIIYNWCLGVSIREVLCDLLRTFSLCSGLFHRSEQ